MKNIFLLICVCLISSCNYLGLPNQEAKDSILTEEDKIVMEVKNQLTIQEHPYFMKINLYSDIDNEKLTKLLQKENLIVFPLVGNELNVLVSFDKINSMRELKNRDHVMSEFHKLLLKLWDWAISKT